MNPLMNTNTYWKVSAFGLATIAVAGILVNLVSGNNVGLGSFLEFDWGHNIVHVVLAGAAFYFAFGNATPELTRTATMVFGFVYAALGILGFFVMDLGFLHLELGENLIHLVLGAWALLCVYGPR